MVPNYNHAQFLGRCIAAIVQQQPAPLELIVIDDASTDGSSALIDDLRSIYPLVRALANPHNLGVIGTINRGLREASGDYVLFAAADDWILPGLLARSLALLEANPQVGLCSGPTFVSNEAGEHLRLLPSALPSTRPAFITPDRANALLIRDESWCIGTNALINRVAALELGGFRPELGSSCDDFLYRQLSLAHGACFAPEPLSVFRRVQGSYSSSTFANLDTMRSIMTETLALMTGQFRTLFSESHVARWGARWRYAMLLNLMRAGPTPLDLAAMWPEARIVDRAMCHLARKHKIGSGFFTIFLFLRLRLRDAPQVAKRRIWWAIKGYRLAGYFGQIRSAAIDR